jgi:hypothetical protein
VAVNAVVAIGKCCCLAHPLALSVSCGEKERQEKLPKLTAMLLVLGTKCELTIKH